jgi:hypothetical protein
MYLESAARSFGLPIIDIGMDVTRLADGQHDLGGFELAHSQLRNAL